MTLGTSMVLLEEKEDVEGMKVSKKSSPRDGMRRRDKYRKRAARRQLKNSDMMLDRESGNFAKERILVNVGGVKHETYRSTLKMIPDTRLAWIAENKSSNFEGFDPSKNEYFFDRHPGIFSQILNYYRTGKLHSPSDVCGPLFEEELQFWGIDEKQMEPCCWAKYTEHRDAQANLKVFEDNIPVAEDDIPTGLPAYLTAEEATPREKSAAASCFESFVKKLKPSYFDSERWSVHKRRIFTILEDHRSSIAGKVVTSFSLFFIILSVLSISLQSMRYYYKENNPSLSSNLATTVQIIDIVCFIWFTLEVLLRFFVYCPNRKRFFIMLSNWIDIITVVTYIPQFIQLAVRGELTEEVEIIASIRVLRLFRFFRLSSGLEVLKHTMIASSKEIMLLLLLLMIPVTLFATIVYFCERKVNNTKFKTIPESFWWAIVTMTTVGYGDMAPKTTTGKAFGAFCASCSLLILALPVSIIGNNFSLFYSYAQARLKLPKKSQIALVGAANVLVADTNSSHSDEIDSGDENLSGCENNNPAGDFSLSVAKRYRRDRHSLYAGGMVRNSRRMMRSRSTGVTGHLSDSDKDQRDSPTLTSNKTGTTEVDSQLDYNIEAEERERNGSQNSDSNADLKQESHSKSNGSLSEKPPSGKRRTRSGGQRIHPVITLQMAEDGSTTRLDDKNGDGYVNETFEGGLVAREEVNLSGQRTPPIQDVEKYGGIHTVRRTKDGDRHLAAEIMNRKQNNSPVHKNQTSKGCNEQNGTILTSVIPESIKETNASEETLLDLNKADYDEIVTFR